MVLELCEPYTTKTLITQGMMENRRTYTNLQAYTWLAQLASALAHLHSHRPPIIHRDIKQENLLLKKQAPAAGGGGGLELEAKLADLGLHVVVEPDRSVLLRRRASSLGTRSIHSRLSRRNSLAQQERSAHGGGAGGGGGDTPLPPAQQRLSKCSSSTAALGGVALGIDDDTPFLAVSGVSAGPSGHASRQPSWSLAGVHGGGGVASRPLAPGRSDNGGHHHDLVEAAASAGVGTGTAADGGGAGGDVSAAVDAAAEDISLYGGCLDGGPAVVAVLTTGEGESSAAAQPEWSPFVAPTQPALLGEDFREAADTTQDAFTRCSSHGGTFEFDASTTAGPSSRQQQQQGPAASPAPRAAVATRSSSSRDGARQPFAAAGAAGAQAPGPIALATAAGASITGMGSRHTWAASAAAVSTSGTGAVGGVIRGPLLVTAASNSVGRRAMLPYAPAQAPLAAPASPLLALGAAGEAAAPAARGEPQDTQDAAGREGAASSHAASELIDLAEVEEEGEDAERTGHQEESAADQGDGSVMPSGKAAAEVGAGPGAGGPGDGATAAAVWRGKTLPRPKSAAAMMAPDRRRPHAGTAAARLCGGSECGDGHAAGTRINMVDSSAAALQVGHSHAGTSHAGMDRPGGQAESLSEMLARHPDVVVQPVGHDGSFTSGLRRVHSVLSQFRQSELKQLRQSSFEWVFGLTGKAGSCMYMAPEVFRKLPYNEKADVFSFGVVMYELLSRELLVISYFNTSRGAKLGMHQPEDYAEMVCDGFRPARPTALANDAVWSLIEACWHDDPVQRPDMDTVLVRLQELRREEELHPTDPRPGGLAACGCVIC
ncbi:hypothetical protein HXX76_006610 [Chlamydomonas incerta]|uniref:Protein kinase domain-containing protein n=1 Tax=Chlamydomonas incerta TaxID=51695 RepID=A0A835SZY4_CHLIN|nr:hypothetical protein HXX76_006610 [Chlamydomonas incerta]|eukprot:KAG2436299.1 hypothetical protein HXX76_006610 [Chlamydomonas incerta]